MADDKDYSVMSKDELLAELGSVWETKPDGWSKLMTKISGMVSKIEADEAKAAKEKLLAQLVEVTQGTMATLQKTIDKLKDDGKLEGAEGVWFTYDFNADLELGVNPACRLVKSGRKSSGDGSATKSSYVAHPAKSSELLEEVGSNVMFKEDTEVTIDKVTQTITAGTTFKEAYDHSTNGGWRNRVRMALLKEAGKI